MEIKRITDEDSNIEALLITGWDDPDVPDFMYYMEYRDGVGNWKPELHMDGSKVRFYGLDFLQNRIEELKKIYPERKFRIYQEITIGKILE